MSSKVVWLYEMRTFNFCINCNVDADKDKEKKKKKRRNKQPRK